MCNDTISPSGTTASSNTRIPQNLNTRQQQHAANTHQYKHSIHTWLRRLDCAALPTRHHTHESPHPHQHTQEGHTVMQHQHMHHSRAANDHTALGQVPYSDHQVDKSMQAAQGTEMNHTGTKCVKQRWAPGLGISTNLCSSAQQLQAQISAIQHSSVTQNCSFVVINGWLHCRKDPQHS